MRRHDGREGVFGPRRQRALVAAKIANLEDGQQADRAAPIGAAIGQDNAAEADPL